MPSPAVLGIPNQLVKMYGNAEATTAPKPIKKLCMANPIVRCSEGRLSPTKARNGSMEILMEASIIHNMPAAIHSAGELGMTNNASVVKMAPMVK